MADDSYKTVAEVAAGLRCSPSTVRRWIRAGRIPTLKFSERVVRVRTSEFERFIAEGAAGGAGAGAEMSTCNSGRG